MEAESKPKLNACESQCKNEKDIVKLDSRQKISTWLGRNMRIAITDGRVLVGTFLCTDQAQNIILGSAQEYQSLEETLQKVEPRMLGLAMVPGRHIISLQVDM